MHPKTRIHADPSLQMDQFDRLPDSLPLLILNKLADVRSLGRCAAVSKRFNSLVPLVHDIYIKIDRVVTVDGSDSDEIPSMPTPKPRNIFANFLKMVLYVIKPFHHIRNNTSTTQGPLFPRLSSPHSPAQVLKNFTHVRNLHIELPSGDVGTEEGVLLKWRAEFGCTLQNCVILGGTCVDKKSSISLDHENVNLNSNFNLNLNSVQEDNGTMPESFYTNGGLKLRVVWTISSLIAASTRHYLLQQIIKDHPTLVSLVLTDADAQGTLIMGPKQLKEVRENPLACSASSNRTQVPACNMKLRYAPFLELPGAVGLQGATLVAIRPSCEGSCSGNVSKKESDTFVFGAFDGVLKTTVKALMKRRSYLLEMNGF